LDQDVIPNLNRDRTAESFDAHHSTVVQPFRHFPHLKIIVDDVNGEVGVDQIESSQVHPRIRNNMSPVNAWAPEQSILIGPN
jgi:hypothetical protein